MHGRASAHDRKTPWLRRLPPCTAVLLALHPAVLAPRRRERASSAHVVERLHHPVLHEHHRKVAGRGADEEIPGKSPVFRASPPRRGADAWRQRWSADVTAAADRVRAHGYAARWHGFIFRRGVSSIRFCLESLRFPNMFFDFRALFQYLRLEDYNKWRNIKPCPVGWGSVLVVVREGHAAELTLLLAGLADLRAAKSRCAKWC